MKYIQYNMVSIFGTIIYIYSVDNKKLPDFRNIEGESISYNYCEEATIDRGSYYVNKSQIRKDLWKKIFNKKVYWIVN